MEYIGLLDIDLREGHYFLKCPQCGGEVAESGRYRKQFSGGDVYHLSIFSCPCCGEDIPCDSVWREIYKKKPKLRPRVEVHSTNWCK